MKKKFYSDLKERMKKAQKILSFCTRNKAEFHPAEEGYVLLIPTQLAPEVEAEFEEIVSGAKVEFQVHPKLATKEHLDNLIIRARPETASVNPDLETRSVVIELGGVLKSDPVWGEMTEVLKKDGFFDTWTFVIEGEEHKIRPEIQDKIQENEKGRTVITNEAVTNLKIALGNAQTIDDILNAM